MSQMRNPAPLRFDVFGDRSPNGNGIGPTDLDNWFERYGRFLAVEFKRPSEAIPEGQRIAFDALAREPHWTVVLARGNPPSEILSFALWGETQKPGNADGLRALRDQWFSWVESQMAA